MYMKLNNNLLDIKNTHSTSETNVYSANYVNGKIEGTTLYNNSSGTTGNLTLSDAIENYSHFEVYYTGEYDYIGLIKYFVKSGATYTLDKIRIDGSTYYVFQEKIQIAGTSLTKLTNREYSSNSGISDTNPIKITKIIGYK